MKNGTNGSFWLVVGSGSSAPLNEKVYLINPIPELKTNCLVVSVIMA